LREEPAGGNLPEMVEIALHQNANDGFHLLTLLNNSGHFGVSFFEPVPLQSRVVEIPWELPVSRAVSLVQRKELAFSHDSGRLAITLPELGMFDAIRIECGCGK
jgi:hypothetical protein